MVATGTIRLAVDGRVGTLWIDSVARRNAMSAAMWRELTERAAELGRVADLRVVLVRGAGTDAFCAGADIADFETARTGPANAKDYDDLVERACVALEAIRCPTIALVRGACMGAGLSVATSCDLRVVARDAVFAVPAARLGLGYDPRGVARFLRVYGTHATTVLTLSGERVGAERAYQLGMAASIGDGEEAEATAARLAKQIAELAPLTLAAAKAALRAHALGGEALAADAMRLYVAADASEDYQEGRQAFRDKRPPRFEGK